MNFRTSLSLCFSLAAGSFAGSWDSHTKLNAVEFDESSHSVIAFLDNPDANKKDIVYTYDWTAPGNTIDAAKGLMSILLSAYISGLPTNIYWTVQAVPADNGVSGWGTIGTMRSVRLAPAGYTGYIP